MKEKINFDDSPLFFKCPVCKNKGFSFIGGNVGLGSRLYRCNNCSVVIAEGR